MITAFIPCRAGSERVKNENTRPFGGRPNGLISLKLEQLRYAKVDRVLVSSNDALVLDIAREEQKADPRIQVDVRPDDLSSSSTSTDQLIEYVAGLVPEGVLLWTHVTAPFVDGTLYSQVVHKYREVVAAGEHDSLMTVTKLRTFLWNGKGPLNYDRTMEKWPRTQTLETLYEINSAVFMCDVDLMRRRKDRIGAKPYLFELDSPASIDIDWEQDFWLATRLYQMIQTEERGKGLE